MNRIIANNINLLITYILNKIYLKINNLNYIVNLFLNMHNHT